MDSLKEELLKTYSVGERDFNMMDLREINLMNESLCGINLSGANLAGANLTGADLTGANLTNADLSQAILARANLSGANLSWAKFHEADMVGVNLSNAVARATNWTEALLIRANLVNIDALGAVLNKANLMAANLENAILECSSLVETNFTNANLAGATLSWANLCCARMNWAILSWSTMDACNLEKANLTGACLRASNLSFANLEDTIFTGADLFFANLSGACLNVNPVTAGFSRLASSRINLQTYDRSGWTPENLRAWQNAGASIIGLSDFPPVVQDYIRSHRCNLRIYYSTTAQPEMQIAYNCLLDTLFGDQNSIRVLSTSNDKNIGSIAFLAKDEEQITPFVDSVKNCPWKTSPENYFAKHKTELEKRHLSIANICSILDKASDAIIRVEILLKSQEEETLRLSANMNKISDKAENESQENKKITWSYVNLPRINYRPC